MSDDQFDDDDDSPTVTLKRSEIRALEKKAKRVDEVEAKLTNYERDATFRTAGLDPADKRHARFIKGYDGDPTAEAIKNTAIEEGFLEAPKQDEQLTEDAAVLNRMAASQATAQILPPSQTAQFEAELAQAKSVEEVTAVAAKYGRVAIH